MQTAEPHTYYILLGLFNINMKYLIYALVDSVTNEVRYIGKSTKGMYRPRQHFMPSYLSRKDHCHSWIRSQIAKGHTPIIIVLEVLEENDHNLLIQKEIFWISYYRRRGAKLTNLTNGGEGTVGFTPSKELKALWSKQKSGKKNGPLADYHKEKLRKAAPKKSVIREDGKIYESVTAAANDLQVHKSSMKYALKLGRKVKGYGFKYVCTN